MKQSIETLRTELAGRLRFETLLAETSSLFVNIPSDRLDNEIEETQRRICELLALDRSTLWQVREHESGALLLTHLHQPPGSAPPPKTMDAREYFPWTAHKVLAGEAVLIAKVSDLPPEADRDRETYRQYGTKSTVIVPLSIGGGPVFGALSFAAIREERDWPETVLKGFRLIAQVFANALARKRADRLLRESEEGSWATFDQAAVGIAHVGIDGRWLRVNDKLCAIVGYSREELMQLTFQDITYPDDLEADLGYVRQVLCGEIKTYSMEKRYFRKDRSLVWINLTVSLVRTAEGEPQHFIAVVEDVTERKQAEQALEEQLEFETLLAEISSRFVNVPASEVDREIEDAQRRVCNCLELDLSALWQSSPAAPEVYTLTHWHRPPGDTSAPDARGMRAHDYFPWCLAQLLSGRVVVVSSVDSLPAEAARDQETWRQYGVKTSLTFPLSTGGGSTFGFLSFNDLRRERAWDDVIVQQLRLVAQVFANALARKRVDEEIQKHLQQIENLKQRLEKENIYLQEEVKLLAEHTEIVGQSLAIRKVLTQAEQVGGTDSTVLIQGETGTGKELLARAIHVLSSRKDRPLVTVNCASLPPTLIESELFGRERGAYTGALTRMAGRFEIADGSTLFLDEIGELPLDVQSKLLRVLEEGSFERLGSTKTLHVNVRIIAATSRDLGKDVNAGRFRKDLYYRLNVFPITIPPLRERPEDIPLMVAAFVTKLQKGMGKKIETISKKSIEALKSYSWPGNVRELKNVIEHAMILSKDNTLVIRLPKSGLPETDVTQNLRDMERMHMVSVLEKTGWRVSGKGGAAEALGLKRTTLEAKMKKLGIKRPNK